MTNPRPQHPTVDEQRPEPPDSEQPGTNAIEHEPDPKAEPIADGQHPFIRRSPYTAGND